MFQRTLCPLVVSAAAVLLFAGCSGGGSRSPQAAQVVQPTSSAAPSTTLSTGPIGYVGCSNTEDIIKGYHAGGGTRFWPAIHEYSGGTVVAWAKAIGPRVGAYWVAFNDNLRLAPTKVVWFQFCVHPTDSEQANYDGALAVIAEVQRLIPGVTIYVSPINGYVAPHVCDLLGPEGPAVTQRLADRLASEGKALRGPDVGELMSLDPEPPSAGATSANNQTLDSCHPNKVGAAALASNLRAFAPFSD